MSAIATITVNNGQVSAVSYRGKKLGAGSSIFPIIQQELQALANNYAAALRGEYQLQTLANKEVRLILGSKEIACFETARKIQRAIERQIVFQTTTSDKKISESVSTSPISSNQPDKSISLKNIKNALNWFLLKTVGPAKICDIMMIGFFTLSLIALHFPVLLPFALILAHVAGYINLGIVGPMVIAQAVKNAINAYKIGDKKALVFSISGAIFGGVVMSLGIVSIVALSDQLLFRALLGTIAGFALIFASYNTMNTFSIIKDFNNSNLRSFLEKRLQVTDEEHQKIEKRIASYTEEEIDKRLSKKKLKEFQQKKRQLIYGCEWKLRTSEFPFLEEKRKVLLLEELEKLQKRKLESMQSILRDDLIQRSIKFLDNVTTTREEEQKLSKDIKIAFGVRLAVELIRVLSPAIGVTAYFLNAFHSISDQGYKWMMVSSIALAAPLNWVKAWRNIETKEDEKKSKEVASDYLKPSFAI